MSGSVSTDHSGVTFEPAIYNVHKRLENWRITLDFDYQLLYGHTAALPWL